MEKKFRLPKPFAIKWLEALRSGKYIQASGMLTKPLFIDTPPTENELNNFGFCCLGVAGHICGNPIGKLTTGFLYTNKGEELVNIPSEILKTYESTLESKPMVHILATLNDGINKTSVLSGYNVRPDVSAEIDETLNKGKDYRFSFTQIADFIEDNVEFYETEEK